MKWSGVNTASRWVLLAACWSAGCVGFEPTRIPPPPGLPTAAQRPVVAAPADGLIHPCRAVLTPPQEQPSGPTAGGPSADLFANELTVEALVAHVLTRNPSLAQMSAAWQATAARFPQVTSLDDPMVAVTLGPASFGSSSVNPAYRLEISQKYPFPGKLPLRGQTALAEARAAGSDVEDMRLQLIESAQVAFFDYFLVARALEVNEESLRLLREFKKNAEARVKAGLGAPQDILQADVEMGRQTERSLLLERMRKVAVARIDTLLDLPPDGPLPAPPREMALREALPDAASLRAAALAQRPDLQALGHRIAADEATLALAHKEYYPDFEPFVMYDRFMGNNSASQDLAPMAGVKLNLPVRLARRDGAVAEAHAKIAQRRAELARLADQVNYDVQLAFEQVRESEGVVHLYQSEVLPKARENVKAAQADYVAGRVPFLSLLEAQRNLVGLQDRYYEATADYFRRRAALERAVGGRLGGGL